MLFNLYKYEFRKFKNELILFFGLTLIINGYTAFKVLSGGSSGMGVGINMLLLFATFISPILLSEYKLISQEYKDNTIYLIKSLPVSSKESFLSKHLASMSVYLISSIFVGILTVIQLFIALKMDPKIAQFSINLKLLDGTTIKEISQIIFSLGLTYFSSIVMFFVINNALFLSSTVGKSVKKYSKTISVVSLFFIVYLIVKFTNLSPISNLLSGKVSSGFITSTILFNLVFLGISAVLFFANCKLYDEKIQL